MAAVNFQNVIQNSLLQRCIMDTYRATANLLAVQYQIIGQRLALIDGGWIVKSMKIVRIWCCEWMMS